MRAISAPRVPPAPGREAPDCSIGDVENVMMQIASSCSTQGVVCETFRAQNVSPQVGGRGTEGDGCAILEWIEEKQVDTCVVVAVSLLDVGVCIMNQNLLKMPSLFPDEPLPAKHVMLYWKSGALSLFQAPILKLIALN